MGAVPRIPPLDRPATYDDLVQVPDNMVAEIVDGELHATPRPLLSHAHAGLSLGVLIGAAYQFGRGGPGGWWMILKPEIHLREDVLVPDIAGWRRTRLPSVPDAAYFTLAPDWVCEVLSPSTAALDRVKKLSIYAREAVGHAWLLDPAARTLEVLRLEAGRWTILATYAGSDIVRAEPFADIDLELALLWGDAPE